MNQTYIYKFFICVPQKKKKITPQCVRNMMRLLNFFKSTHFEKKKFLIDWKWKWEGEVYFKPHEAWEMICIVKIVYITLCILLYAHISSLLDHQKWTSSFFSPLSTSLNYYRRQFFLLYLILFSNCHTHSCTDERVFFCLYFYKNSRLHFPYYYFFLWTKALKRWKVYESKEKEFILKSEKVIVRP